MALQPTEQQRQVINDKAGLFTVHACPGSGKTLTVAARLQRMLSAWRPKNQGIAVASFTNVAWKEIAQYLENAFGCRFPGYPHFLGTLDSFTNRYVFLPFGHLVMRSQGRPVLCGPPHDDTEPIGNWMYWGRRGCNEKECKLNEFTYDPEGNIVRLRYPNMGDQCTEPVHPCVSRKRSFNQQGYATQSDANYFALQILTRYPVTAAALAQRFPVILVDEAQDTSAIQMAIIDRLVDAGVQELMLVGDPDQAIYEWRDADPSVFLRKCESWGENSAPLTENWRSSQLICDCASRLSSRSEPMTAANPSVASIDLQPKVIGYTKKTEIPQIVNTFAERCSSLGLDESKIHVLARSNDLLNDVAPGTIASAVVPWVDDAPLSRPLAQAKYLHDRRLHAEALRVLERALLRAQHPTASGPVSLRELYQSPQDMLRRGDLFVLLTDLPSTDTILLGDWMARATEVLRRREPPFNNIELCVKRRSHKCNYPMLSFSNAFGAPTSKVAGTGFTARTVHGAKGESLDAVLVVLGRKPGRSRRYVNLLGRSITEHEELRVVYVAMTRAKSILALAVPAEDATTWREHLGLDAESASVPPCHDANSDGQSSLAPSTRQRS